MKVMNGGKDYEVVRKRERLLPATVVIALIGTFVILLSTIDSSGIEKHGGFVLFAVKACLLFLPLASLHELVHYATIKALGGQAKIEPLIRYGSIAVAYEKLTWINYVATTLTPQVALTIPLLIAWLLTSDALIHVLLIAHVMSSLPDIVNAARILLLHRGCEVELLRMDRKIVGYAIIKENGRRIEYYLKLR